MTTPAGALPATTTTSLGIRTVLMGLALLCAAAGLWLAAHHPLSAPAALAAFVLAGAAFARWPAAWPLALPALLPWLALAPWTGWITFEELDLLVLATAAGGYARWAIRPMPAASGRNPALAMLVCWLLLALWTASVGVSLARGVADAGGWHFGWYEGYRGPMNALRLAKPTLAVLLLLPLWQRLIASPSAQACDRLTLGLALGHGGAALACFWERAVYPGVLNFSTDYRTTGPFWEMHVGGAALDGFLALTFPFALLLWWRARRRSTWLLASAIVLLGVYAVLSTFSRILLLAVPLGVGLLWLLRHLQPPPAPAAAATTPPAGTQPGGGHARKGAGLGLWAIAVAGAFLVFPTAGYRGMLALLGNATLLLVLGPRLAGLSWRQLSVALAIALAAGPALLALATLHGKGPYLVYTLVWLLGAAAVAGTARAELAWLKPVALAALAVGLASTVQVAVHWGGAAAWTPAAMAVALLAAVALACLRPRGPPWWPAALRWQAGHLLAMATAMLLIGMAGGGAYLGERLATADQDQRGRWQHWSLILDQLANDRARWLGQGLGRFVDVYALAAGPGQRPGDIRLVPSDGARPTVRMIAGTHVQGWGEVLRLSQRIERPLGLGRVVLALRNPAPAQLHAEVCLKHLLYDEACQTVNKQVPPSGADGQTVTLTLAGPTTPPDPWYAHRFTVFSLATESSATPLTLRSVSLQDANGRELLTNGDFAQGGARWFFSSDRNHMPWHAKNMAVHLLFEQGRLGLAAMLLLTAAAGWALVLGRARTHPLAPALAGGLAGFWAVGMIDSLLDMPRVATLFLLLTVVSLALPTPPAPSASPGSG